MLPYRVSHKFQTGAATLEKTALISGDNVVESSLAFNEKDAANFNERHYIRGHPEIDCLPRPYFGKGVIGRTIYSPRYRISPKEHDEAPTHLHLLYSDNREAATGHENLRGTSSISSNSTRLTTRTPNRFPDGDPTAHGL